MDFQQSFRRHKNPKEKTNFFNKILFLYVYQIFKINKKGDIKENDLYEVYTQLQSRKLGDKMEKIYLKLKKENNNLSTFKMVTLFCYKKYLVLTLLQLIMKTFFVICTPFILGKFIKLFEIKNKNEFYKDEQIYYGILYIILLLIQHTYQVNYNLLKMELLIELQTALCSLIYRKSLRLKPEALSNITNGKIVSLITKDINAFEIIFFLNDLFIELIQMVILLYLFYRKIGNASYAGFFVLLMALPVQITIAKIVKTERVKSNEKSDQRYQLTENILSTMKTIKMYAIETFFEKKIKKARRTETKKLRLILILKDISFLLGSFASTMSFYTLISVYVWMGNELEAEIVFYIMSAFENLETTATHSIPNCLSRFAEFMGCIGRYDTFFNATETTSKDTKTDGTPLLKLRNNNYKKGMNIVAGPVGSGKSFLIKSILQECNSVNSISLCGNLSYASQDPWMFPSTLRQNILFGEKYNESKYQKVLKICALDFDMKLLENGDQTIIGDCGVNLSKGQQARVNLARTVYKDADIYLLDDCLSSLDANVKKYVFDQLKHHLRNKICLLVTHNTDIINNSENVVFIGHDNMKYNGSNSVLMESSKKIAEINDEENKSEYEPLMSENKLNIYEENQNCGTISWKIYNEYVKLGGGFMFFSIIIILVVSGGSLFTYGRKVLSEWVDIDEQIKNISSNENFTNINLESDRRGAFNLFTICTSLGLLCYLLSLMSHFVFSCNVSRNIHNKMIEGIFRAKMSFFDSNLVGNILNRFSKDLYYIDEELVFAVNDFFFVFVLIISTSIMISFVNVVFCAASIIFVVIYIYTGYCLLPICRNLRRINNSTRSPVVGYLKSSLDGLVTIRASKSANLLSKEFDSHQDLFTSAFHTRVIFQAGYVLLLHIISLVFTSIIIGNFILIKSDTAGNVGLALTQVSLLTRCIEVCINIYIALESDMTCMERALEYTKLKTEKISDKFIKNWPSRGTISFENVYLSYGADKITTLNDISFKINENERVAIIGRTGAGKSSLVLALYRLYEHTGKITIDDVDISTISLKQLRESITLIPQDPYIIEDTLRINLDPLNKYSDSDLWKVIEYVGLHKRFNNLQEMIKSHDVSLSMGQKQLLCIARGLLQKNKIIVLDEATANMDEDMHNFINVLLEKHLMNCTVVMITHVLNNVFGFDKVIVIEKGKLVQFGRPNDLLKDKNGIFYQMAVKTRD